jgi:hypothetical protein
VARPDLTLQARQAIPFVESGLARGLSMNAIQRSLSEAGIGVRRAELLEVGRRVRGAELAADRLKFVRPDYRPDPALLAESISGKQLRGYSFTVRIRGLVELPGGAVASGERYVNVATDELLSRAEIEEAAEAFLEDDEVYEPFVVESVELLTATRQ